MMKSVFPVFEEKLLMRRKNHELSHFLTLDLLAGRLTDRRRLRGRYRLTDLLTHCQIERERDYWVM